MTAALRSIGLPAPPATEQSEAADLACELTGRSGRAAEAVRLLYGQAGVHRRGLTARPGSSDLFHAGSDHGPGTAQRIDHYRRAAGDLAARACRDALARSGVDGHRITHLVVVSCTGFHAPGIDVGLIRDLPLRPDIARVTVGFMGCHGALNGLRVAEAFAQADPEASVLLCCVEVCSAHFQYRARAGAATANALFADGAAACVVTASGRGPRLRSFASRIFPDTEDEMSWAISDHGFVMSLSARVPSILRASVGGWVDSWLSAQGLSRADIGHWVIHPGGPRIIDAAAEALGLGPDIVPDSRAVLAAHGNMSSPTVLFILRRLLDRGCAGRIAMLAFGPGLAGEAVLLES